jgi:hypothetical protein
MQNKNQLPFLRYFLQQTEECIEDNVQFVNYQRIILLDFEWELHDQDEIDLN